MKSWVRKDILPFPATYVTHEKACITSYYCNVMAKPICLPSFPTGERAYQGHWQLVPNDKIVKESMMGSSPHPGNLASLLGFYANVGIYSHAHIHARTHSHTLSLTHTCTHTRIHTLSHAHVRIYTPPRVHAHGHVPMHACTHTLVVSGLTRL